MFTAVKAEVKSLVETAAASWSCVRVKSRTKTLLSLSVSPQWRDEIDRRAALLNLTRATYATLILAKWWADGRPPVTEPDRLMQLAGQSIKRETDTKTEIPLGNAVLKKRTSK
jgi:hypothetical protein